MRLLRALWGITSAVLFTLAGIAVIPVALVFWLTLVALIGEARS